jgi:Asp/Glu/hydantoin racemase
MLKKVLGVASVSLLATENTVNANHVVTRAIDQQVLNIQRKAQDVKTALHRESERKVREAQEVRVQA